MSLLTRLERRRTGAGVEADGPNPHIRPNDSARSVEPTPPGDAGRRPAARARRVDPYVELKAHIHDRLVDELDASLLAEASKRPDAADGDADVRARTERLNELKRRVTDVVVQVIEDREPGLTKLERRRVQSEVLDEVTGYGPINSLLQDPEVSEVMVNGPRRVFAERGGRIEATPVHFRDDAHIMRIIEKIVAPLGRRIDEGSPMVDARLPDGSRVNAVIPPLALNGPTLTIRKFSPDPFTIDDLVAFGSLTPAMAELLDACVKVRLNVVVSGGTGSGKTTLLGVLSSLIPDDERIVTIEDAAELQLRQEHVVSLESRPPNMEGKGAVTIRDLVRNALRMRPDRIVVGEVRGGEALDMLQAMNTGHDGSLTTGHANTPRDMISRLETMVLMAGMELPVRAIREQIASAVDLIVQTARLRDGSRKVTRLTEVQGMEGEVITMQDIFVFEQRGLDENGSIVGGLKPTGIRPRFYDRFQVAGIELPPTLFGV